MPSAARYLDVNSGDFVSLDDGTLDSMPAVRQRVVLALVTELDSAFGLPGFGNGVMRIKRIDQTIKRRVQNAVRAALRQLSEVERLIRIDAIEVEDLGSGRLSYTVSYTDLTNAEPDEVSIGL